MQNKVKYEKLNRSIYTKIELELLFYKVIKVFWLLSRVGIKKRLKVLKSTQHNFDLLQSKKSFKNFCIITERSKSVYKKFKISRIQIKQLAGERMLPGLHKASW